MQVAWSFETLDARTKERLEIHPRCHMLKPKSVCKNIFAHFHKHRRIMHSVPHRLFSKYWRVMCLSTQRAVRFFVWGQMSWQFLVGKTKKMTANSSSKSNSFWVEKSKSHDLETERSSEWLQAIRLPFYSAIFPLWATEFNFRIVPKYLLTYLLHGAEFILRS